MSLRHALPVLCCVTFVPLAHALPAWEVLGPPGGSGPVVLRTSHLDQNRVLGLWRRGAWFIRVKYSMDGGLSWTDGLDTRSTTQRAGESLAWDAQAVGVAYAGVYPVADRVVLYRTTDAGASWAGLTVADVERSGWLAADPVVGGRLFVGLNDGILRRSVDGGESFTAIEDVDVGIRGAIWSNPFDPDQVILVARGVFRSSDGGLLFADFDPDFGWRGLRPDRSSRRQAAAMRWSGR